ncbi:hypothetical protein CLAIMM_11145, partial [Cladophialophora immunda]
SDPSTSHFPVCTSAASSFDRYEQIYLRLGLSILILFPSNSKPCPLHDTHRTYLRSPLRKAHCNFECPYSKVRSPTHEGPLDASPLNKFPLRLYEYNGHRKCVPECPGY